MASELSTANVAPKPSILGKQTAQDGDKVSELPPTSFLMLPIVLLISYVRFDPSMSLFVRSLTAVSSDNSSDAQLSLRAELTRSIRRTHA